MAFIVRFTPKSRKKCGILFTYDYCLMRSSDSWLILTKRLTVQTSHRLLEAVFFAHQSVDAISSQIKIILLCIDFLFRIVQSVSQTPRRLIHFGMSGAEMDSLLIIRSFRRLSSGKAAFYGSLPWHAGLEMLSYPAAMTHGKPSSGNVPAKETDSWPTPILSTATTM